MPWAGEPGPAKRRWVIEGLHDCREERTEDGEVVHTIEHPRESKNEEDQRRPSVSGDVTVPAYVVGTVHTQ